MARAASACINTKNTGFRVAYITSIENLSLTLLQLLTTQHRVVFEKLDHLYSIYEYELSRTTEEADKDSKLSGEN